MSLNKMNQEALDFLKEEIKNKSNKDNKLFYDKTQHLIKCVEELDLFAKFDLLVDDVSVERISDNSIGVYFNLARSTKLIVAINESEYVIFYKQNVKDDWQKKYVENNTELSYFISQFL